ncbi:hypothetical protein EB093_02835 [bacterium]|nr:hypothetical protein [bacterium]
MLRILLVDDPTAIQLRPVTDLRSIATIPLGSQSIIECWANHYPSQPLHIMTRPEWMPEIHRQVPQVESTIPEISNIVSVTRCFPPPLVAMIDASLTTTPTFFTSAGRCVAITGDRLEAKSAILQLGKPITDPTARQISVDDWVIDTVWDIIALPDRIAAVEFDRVRTRVSQRPSGMVSVPAPEATWISPSATIDDFVTLDARSGPIVIDDGGHIESHTRISGPTYIGKHTSVLGGKIRGCCIGAHCKISGEISASLIAGFSNKAHDGFFGHSYIGQWVNIGAGSITSNLKNTYGSVSLNYNGERIDTGLQFLGSIIGDHAKLGIGTHLATGSVVGTGASIFGTHIHDKWIPNFAWGEAGHYSRYKLDAFTVTAARVRARRGLTFRDDELTLVTQLYAS